MFPIGARVTPVPRPRPAPWFRVALTLAAIGWGANHFVALMPIYRVEDDLSQTTVTGLFAAYVVGLAPALVIAARIGRRTGHRTVLRACVVMAVVASVILALGGDHALWLFVGRVLYGAAMGAAMAPGTTWIKELSAGTPLGTGARRAAVSLTAGFGGGPVGAGVLVQWLPAPQLLPYLLHIALTLVAGVFVWHVPTPRPDPAQHVVGLDETSGPIHDGRPHLLRTRWFWTDVAPGAPWVFTCASLALVTLPVVIGAGIADVLPLFAGIMAAVTLGTGALVQPWARRLEARRHGLTLQLGAAASCLGIVLGLVVGAQHSVPLALVAAVVLGCGYGLALVGGLTQVEGASRPDELAMSNAVFYCLTYIGFFVPMTMSAIADRWSMEIAMVCLLALALVTLASAIRIGRTNRR